MKLPLLAILVVFIALTTAKLYSSEYTMNDYGNIISIDGIEIDWHKVGVLKYEYKLTTTEEAAINNALKNHAVYCKKKYIIAGSKKINDAIVLTMGEHNVADGGVDIVYSTLSKRIIGRFVGGLRG